MLIFPRWVSAVEFRERMGSQLHFTGSIKVLQKIPRRLNDQDVLCWKLSKVGPKNNYAIHKRIL